MRAGPGAPRALALGINEAAKLLRPEALVAELVDATDLKSVDLKCHPGSIPGEGTKFSLRSVMAMNNRSFRLALLLAALAAISGCAIKPEKPENVRFVDYHQKTTQCRKIKVITATQGAPPHTDVLAEAMGSAHKQVAAAGGNGIYIVSRTVEPGVSALVKAEALRCQW